MNCCINDMYLAAAVLSYGGKMGMIDRTDKKRQKFVFNANKFTVWYLESGKIDKKEVDLDQLTALYLSKQLMLPCTYIEALRNIKSAIHQLD